MDKVIACESLYNRIVKLKRRVEAFKLIVIPIFITIIFGVLVTYGFEQIGEARNVREEFLINAQTLWDKKTADLTFEEAEKNTVLYNEILQETLRDITIALVLMVMIIFIIAYLLSRLIVSVKSGIT